MIDSSYLFPPKNISKNSPSFPAIPEESIPPTLPKADYDRYSIMEMTGQDQQKSAETGKTQGCLYFNSRLFNFSYKKRRYVTPTFF